MFDDTSLGYIHDGLLKGKVSPKLTGYPPALPHTLLLRRLHCRARCCSATRTATHSAAVARQACRHTVCHWEPPSTLLAPTAPPPCSCKINWMRTWLSWQRQGGQRQQGAMARRRRQRCRPWSTQPALSATRCGACCCILAAGCPTAGALPPRDCAPPGCHPRGRTHPLTSCSHTCGGLHG